MKAVAQAGFLDPMIDPEKNLERLGARISGKSVESSTFEDPVNGRPSCESLGITQSIDDMLAIEQVIRESGVFSEESLLGSTIENFRDFFSQ